jgi:glycerol-3-phosphate acyltransferase PlsX
MGGDYAPDINIDGTLLAFNDDPEITLQLVGDRPLILKKLEERKTSESERLQVVHADEVITMEDTASQGMRKKKGSSIHVGLQQIKEGKAHAFISAGNSGAVMAVSIMVLGRLEGVERPAILIKLPSLENFVILLDAGANVDCKPSHLFQFAEMGRIYAELVENRKKPTIGLLSNGSEESKGNELTRETHALLKEANIPNYKGYVEGFDIYRGTTDIVVCDGFVGNVALKVSEGLAETSFNWVKKEVSKHKISGLIGLAFLRGTLKAFKQKFDYKPYGSAPLLGVDGVVFISHGSSNAVAIRNGILTAKKGVETQFLTKMRDQLLKKQPNTKKD